MNKEKMKSLSKWLAIGVLGVLAVFSVVSAFSGNAQNVAENGATINVYNQGEVQGVSEFLGATANRIPHGYLDTSDGYYVDGTSVIDGSGDVSTTDGTFSSSLIAATFTQGGGVTATSTIGTTVPLVASDFDTENVIDVTLNVSDATVSFPATSTLTSFIPTAGQTRTLFIRNATTTAAMDLTMSGGTGVLMKFASSTEGNKDLLVGDTDGGNHWRVTLLRKANTDIEALAEKFVD